MILDKILSYRASLENPSTSLSNPASWLCDWAGGGQASSGVSVNQETALKYSPVYASVRLISEAIASLPLHVFKRDGQSKERFPEHPVHALLHDSPNAEMTAIIFRELLSVHVLLWGNAFAFIARNNAGIPIELIPLMPDRTFAERKEGRLQYVTSVDNARMVLRPDQVLHIPGLSFDGITGKSPITLARESIGLGLAAEGYGSAFFSNTASPRGVLEHPLVLDDEARANIKKSWNANYQGFGQAHKTALLEEGMKFNPLSLSQKDAEFLETRKFQVTDIARWFKVPPSLIGDLERATFKNSEQQNLSFLIYSLTPWLVRYEQEYNRKLFREDEKNKVFAEHDVDGLLRGDQKTRYEAYRNGIGTGWLTRNEARMKENLNPIEGLDDPLQPLNMLPVGEEPNPDTDPDDDGDNEEENSLRQIMSQVLGDAARRIVKREVSEIRRSVKKRSGTEFDGWVEEYYKEFRGVMIQTLKPFARDGLALNDINLIADQHIAESRTLLKLCSSRSVMEGALGTWEQTRTDPLHTLCGDNLYGN